MNLQVPDWLIPKTTPWQQLAVGAQVGAHIAQARYRNQAMRIQVEEQAQREVLAMQALDLRREQQTTMNQMRLQQMEEEKAEAADLPLLQEYARNPEAGPPAFKSPKSYARLAQIDLARQRSDLGRQTALDMKDFYNRLKNVAAEDRAAVSDMQRAGAPAAEVWAFLGQAEERQRAKLQAEKQFAPSPVRKTLDEATAAMENGKIDEAKILFERAETLARGGRAASIQGVNVPLTKFRARVQQLHNMFRQQEIKPEAYQKALDEAVTELESTQGSPTPAAAPATPTPQSNDPLGIRP